MVLIFQVKGACFLFQTSRICFFFKANLNLIVVFATNLAFQGGVGVVRGHLSCALSGQNKYFDLGRTKPACKGRESPFFQTAILGEEEEPVFISQVILTFVILRLSMKKYTSCVFTKKIALTPFGSCSRSHYYYLSHERKAEVVVTCR